MDFIDKIRGLAKRIPDQLPYCKTEEATKTALVMPFISALGYDVFDPAEVVPELVADIGMKKGEKLDYAIHIGGNPVILFECKWSGADLNREHASQLYRYFATLSGPRFGVLTNGVEYRFFSDLDAPNRMDAQPFLVFSMLDVQERKVAELKKFTKSAFNLDEIVSSASELKYTNAITAIFSQEFEAPSEDLVRLITSQVYPGVKNKNVMERFTDLTHTAMRRFLNDAINERLQSAIHADSKPPGEMPSPPEPAVPGDDATEIDAGKREVTTSIDEIEGFFAVKSILRDVIDLKRIQMRDTQSYFGVLLDDNNRKPICRLHFNTEQLYVTIFDQNRKEEKHPIDGVDDIYKFSKQIIAIVQMYESQK